MDERETLGKIAYEAYRTDFGYKDPELCDWEEWSDVAKNHWIAVAQAVAERVIQDLQTSVEASE